MKFVCERCGIEPMEDFGDGEPGPFCISCNDREINRSKNILEWQHYHPGQPCPKSELDKIR